MNSDRKWMLDLSSIWRTIKIIPEFDPPKVGRSAVVISDGEPAPRESL